MSKIDELLKDEKVEWKKLGEVCEIVRGIRVTKKELIDNGQYPVVSGGIGYMGYVNQYNRGEDTITIAQYGTAGYVCWQKEKFWANDVCFSVYPNYNVVKKYLYHFLLQKQEYLYSISNKSAVPYSISKEKILKIEIPIPSIETQEKIVKTLDKFTNYVTELQAELQDRTKQYEYYRDMLLSEEYLNKISKEINGHGKDYEVKVTTLGECVNIILGGTPNKDKNEYWDNGTIPWMSSGEVNKKTVYNTNSFITQKGYDNSSATMVPKNSTVIALAGQGKTRGLVARIKIELTTNQSLATLIPSKNLNNDYLYYYLTGQYLKLREVSSGDGSRGGLNKEILKKYQILVPSVKVQERIVSILDKFDSIVNDISKGLPKEIELRQKQYEHYREKLLTFEK